MSLDALKVLLHLHFKSKLFASPFILPLSYEWTAFLMPLKIPHFNLRLSVRRSGGIKSLLLEIWTSAVKLKLIRDTTDPEPALENPTSAATEFLSFRHVWFGPQPDLHMTCIYTVTSPVSPIGFITVHQDKFSEVVCLNMQIRYCLVKYELICIHSSRARFKILVLFCWHIKYDTWTNLQIIDINNTVNVGVCQCYWSGFKD